MGKPQPTAAGTPQPITADDVVGRFKGNPSRARAIPTQEQVAPIVLWIEERRRRFQSLADLHPKQDELAKAVGNAREAKNHLVKALALLRSAADIANGLEENGAEECWPTLPQLLGAIDGFVSGHIPAGRGRPAEFVFRTHVRSAALVVVRVLAVAGWREVSMSRSSSLGPRIVAKMMVTVGLEPTTGGGVVKAMASPREDPPPGWPPELLPPQ